MVNSWSAASVPASRDNKPGWYKLHFKNAKTAFNTLSDTLLIGDSIVSGMSRYRSTWNKYFENNAINQGIGGDMTQHVSWRLRNTRLSKNIKFVVVHCGTNNIDFNKPDDIAGALIAMAEKIHLYRPEVKVILSGILPRDSVTASIRREKIKITNNLLMGKCINLHNVYYLDHDDANWTHDDGRLKKELFYTDNLHLVKTGNEKLSSEIIQTIQKIRNNDGFGGNNPYVIPPSYSCHKSSHSSTQTSHIGKIDHVKKPRYEECEYVHTSSIPQSFSASPPRPRKQRRQQQRRQPQPQSLSSTSPSSSTPSSLLSALPILFLSILLFLKISCNKFFNCIYHSLITFLTFIFHIIYLIFHFTLFKPCLNCICYSLYIIYFSANLLIFFFILHY